MKCGRGVRVREVAQSITVVPLMGCLQLHAGELYEINVSPTPSARYALSLVPIFSDRAW